jgi:hypothetical protein
MSKRIQSMSPIEISALPKNIRDRMFREALVHSIGLSIAHGNIDTAKSVFKILPYISKKQGAKEALIDFFESWGNLHHDKAHDELRYNKQLKPDIWTPEYEANLHRLNWADAIDNSKSPQTVYDADEEFRKVIRRLKRVADDPIKSLLHAILLTKIEEVVYAYGRTDAKLEEEKRGRTLFDSSTQMSTLRAGKFAKGS